jgi:dTDP-4-amino-4,6-dideoxy-D-galactose acyltransferase
LELKKLDWDSVFFEMPVYSLEVTDPIGSDALHQILETDEQTLLYVYLKDDYAELHDMLVSQGALFYDTRIIYAKELNKENICNPTVRITDYHGGLTMELEELAVQAGQYSRFNSDPKLRPYFEGLYKSWIENSLSSKIADKVFVHENGDRIHGFVTCAIKNGKGWTGLISVDPSCQGRGVGTSLMANVESYYFEKQIERSLVITQEDNLKACRFYETCGYEISQREFIYHWWI